jgi:hypothetical protein
MLRRISLLTIQLTSDPVKLRIAIFSVLLMLALMAVMLPGAPILADGKPGGPLPTP